MKPEEGFAVAAVGLGCYVVGGQESYRFSPTYPKIGVFTVKDLINCSQVKFYAVDLSKKNNHCQFLSIPVILDEKFNLGRNVLVCKEFM